LGLTTFPTNIISGGDRFTDKREQEAFMQILEKAEAHVAWPCLRAGERLRAFWEGAGRMS
jgi:hypothetical protein